MVWTYEYIGEWYAYDGGFTIGEEGPEGGITLRDEEFGDPEDEEDSHARLTLERGSVNKPGFIITATLYGWMFVLRHIPSGQTAEEIAFTSYTAMRRELEQMVPYIPYEEDGKKKIQEKTQELLTLIAEFESRYATL
jgi:hypothetical protein